MAENTKLWTAWGGEPRISVSRTQSAKAAPAAIEPSTTEAASPVATAIPTHQAHFRPASNCTLIQPIPAHD
jgi:hypothetical protein